MFRVSRLVAALLSFAGASEYSQTLEKTKMFEGTANAPDFPDGLSWLNTSAPIKLKELRGKFVLLDFWTFCCINCMHAIPDLKKLETKYPKNSLSSLEQLRRKGMAHLRCHQSDRENHGLDVRRGRLHTC